MRKNYHATEKNVIVPIYKMEDEIIWDESVFSIFPQTVIHNLKFLFSHRHSYTRGGGW
jgi:hypothetical protein